MSQTRPDELYRSGKSLEKKQNQNNASSLKGRFFLFIHGFVQQTNMSFQEEIFWKVSGVQIVTFIRLHASCVISRENTTLIVTCKV